MFCIALPGLSPLGRIIPSSLIMCIPILNPHYTLLSTENEKKTCQQYVRKKNFVKDKERQGYTKSEHLETWLLQDN